MTGNLSFLFETKPEDQVDDLDKIKETEKENFGVETKKDLEEDVQKPRDSKKTITIKKIYSSNNLQKINQMSEKKSNPVPQTILAKPVSYTESGHRMFYMSLLPFVKAIPDDKILLYRNALTTLTMKYSKKKIHTSNGKKKSLQKNEGKHTKYFCLHH